VEESEIARRYQEIPVASIYEGMNEIMITIITKKTRIIDLRRGR
jgi:alkylation response protein AidB-like acyl-CoA dehydrogenase